MSIDTLEGPSPSDIERALDENAAADYAVLVAVFATGLRNQQQRIARGKELTPGAVYDFCTKLRETARLLTDTYSADGLFHQQCLSDYGPSFVLRALARAYEEVK